MPASEHTLNVIEHKRQVAYYLTCVLSDLAYRAAVHDNSKFSDEENDLYEEALPRFKQSPYGSSEYKEVCKDIKPAIRHHVTTNRHHPEYFQESGYFNGMTLLDLIEMACDWIAASKRNGSDTDISKGMQINWERYSKEPYTMSEQLFQILQNTMNVLR